MRELGGRRLSIEQATAIRKRYAEKNITQGELGKMYGVSRFAINGILTNKTYKE